LSRFSKSGEKGSVGRLAGGKSDADRDNEVNERRRIR